MKSLISILGVVLLTATVADAQLMKYEKHSFLGAAPVSINVTNAVGITNTASSGYATNLPGIIYTNGSGTQVTVAAGNVSSLLSDVSLFIQRDNDHLSPNFAATATNILQTLYPANANISITLVGGSGANSAVTFIFVPVVNGYESSIAGDLFSIAVTATTTTKATVITPFPAYRYPGVSKFRLRSVTNADVDAASQVTVLDVSLNGYTY